MLPIVFFVEFGNVPLRSVWRRKFFLTFKSAVKYCIRTMRGPGRKAHVSGVFYQNHLNRPRHGNYSAFRTVVLQTLQTKTKR